MRDGLSLLDQLHRLRRRQGGRGRGARHARQHLARSRRAHRRAARPPPTATELLRCAQSLEEFAPDYAQVLDELAALLVRVGFKQARAATTRAMSCTSRSCSSVWRSALTPEDVQLYYQTAILGRRDLALAPDPRSGFEMTLLRMLAFRPAGATRAAPRRRAAAALRAPRARRARRARSRARLRQAAAAAAGHRRGRPLGADPGRSSSSPAPRASSPATASSSAARARSCAWRSIRATSWCAPPAQEEKLAQALSRYYGEPVRLEFQAVAAGRSRRRRRRSGAPRTRSWPRRGAPSRMMPGVKGLRERFGATRAPGNRAAGKMIQVSQAAPQRRRGCTFP